MLVELHILQNFAPSNLNRDDTNSPKDCTFGGFRRARISSQCIKRAIRTEPSFSTSVEGKVGVRTKRVHERLTSQLVDKGRDKGEALERTRRALEAVGFKWDESHTAVLLFVDDGELEAWAKVLDEHWDNLAGTVEKAEADTGGKKTKKKTTKEKKQAAAEQVPPETLKALKEAMASANLEAVDIALFGRMVAEHTRMNVDAACQVAHAISTHAVELEMDFYTAVDDLQPKEDTGAGMMGVVEFNSACFYRYAVIDLEQLKKNLQGAKGLSHTAAVAFLKSAVKAIPSGKQNSFAAQNRPDWVRVELRKNAPQSLVNAFAAPVSVKRRDGDLVAESINKVQEYATRLTEMFDDEDVPFVRTATTRTDLCKDAIPVSNLWQEVENALRELDA